MKYLSDRTTRASGSIGGTTFSSNKGGQYTRARRKPTNPNTAFQIVMRNGLGALQTAFRSTLTAAQQAAWAVFAQNVTKVNVLGQTIKLTANQWYIGFNNPRLQASLTRVDAGPTIYALDSLTAPTGTVVHAATTMSIAYTNTDAWANEVGGALLVFASRPQNSSKNFFAGPYRFMGKVAGAGTPPTSPSVMTLPFVAGPVGSKIFIRAFSTRADGRYSPDFRAAVVAS